MLLYNFKFNIIFWYHALRNENKKFPTHNVMDCYHSEQLCLLKHDIDEWKEETILVDIKKIRLTNMSQRNRNLHMWFRDTIYV